MLFEQKWQGKNCRTGELFAASVPGNNQYDLGVAKGFEIVNFADNYKNIPYENDAWAIDFKKREGDRLFWVSDGISSV